MNTNIYSASKETQELIINEYKNGKSMRQLEKDYNITRQSIAKFLEVRGVKTTKGNHYRTYTHDYSYFETIDTEEKAYWLGFMFADGYIASSKEYGEDKFGITLKTTDIDTLYAFKKSINATNPIKDVSRDKRTLSRILCTSQKTVNDLISHGCKKQKSLILEPPIGVPQKLIHHFLRGFFDGDGSIYYDKAYLKEHPGNRPQFTINITSTLPMVEWIVDLVGFGRIAKENRREKTWYYVQSGNIKVKKFCDFIYKDAHIYMERKYQLYQLLLSMSKDRV